jgi:nucleoside-diphosphate-sugar epimerase
LAFTDPDYVIKTAVGGTRSILESAKRVGGPQLKSFILMSSIAAITGPKDPPHTYTEDEWNEFSSDKVARLGEKADGGEIYRASKTEAERAFWKFRDVEKPSFYMAAVNPV